MITAEPSLVKLDRMFIMFQGMLLLLLLSHFSRVQLCVTPWTLAYQAPLSVASLQARILEWVAMPFSMGSF